MYVPGFTPQLQGGPARATLGMEDASVGARGTNAAQIRAREQAMLQAPQAPRDPATGFIIGDGGLIGLPFYSNRGNLATNGGAGGFVPFDQNAQYVFVNRRDGSVMSSGTGADGLRGALTQSQLLGRGDKNKADWEVVMVGPDGQQRSVAADGPSSSIIGTIADFGLPVLGGLLAPVTGGLSGALAAGLGAAGGSAVSSVLQGRSVSDTLKRAGISGLTAGALSGAGSALGGALGGGGGGAAGGSLAGGVAGAGTMGAVGAQLAGLGGNILVQGAAGSLGAALGGGLGATAGSALSGALSGRGNEIVVETARPDNSIPGLPLAAAPIAAAPVVGALGGSAPTPPANEIVVEGNRPTSFDNTPAPPLTTTVPVTPVQQPPVTSGGEAPAGEKDTLDDIIKYLRAGSLGIGLVGSLFGGQGGRQNGVIPGGLGGGLSPVFSGGLPAATLPGASDNFAQRPADLDWKRYGYGPGQSFFNYVPQGQPNTSQAYTGYAQGGEVMGGGMPMSAESFAVQGAGTGRSDEIPALLSDGEYVFDAETVALLGDGSTKAGADRLDQFRVNIRKHKGQQLAKGGFSPDAKSPEHYLLGGRA